MYFLNSIESLIQFVSNFGRESRLNRKLTTKEKKLINFQKRFLTSEFIWREKKIVPFICYFIFQIEMNRLLKRLKLSWFLEIIW